MKLVSALYPGLLALAVALTAFAAPVSAAAAPATVPTWVQGQAVAYGTHIDIGSLADTFLTAIRSNPSAFNITSINALNVTGGFDSWEVDTVTQATASYYTLGMQSATGFKLHVAANLTMNNLPTAGTYTGTFYYGYCIAPTIPRTTGTEAVTLDATALNVGNGARRLQASNLAYVNETDDVTVQALVTFTGFHLPTTSLNTTTCKATVSYENPTFSLTVDTQDQARIYYGAWDFFNFPINDNKTWWANTTATIGATLAGTINVQGLSSKDETSFFDNLTKSLKSAGLTATGLSSFPIDLAKVSLSAGTSYIVHNGVVTDYPVPLDQNYRAISAVQTLSDGSQHPVYLIANATYQCPPASGSFGLPVSYASVYAPDFPAAGAGMIVGYQLLVCSGTTNLPGFSLTNTKPSDAQKNIGQTQTTYAVVPPQTNALADFFLSAPYLGLILIAVVVVAVAALLVMRRRRKPMMAPPAAQPPASPPPPPSGPGNP